jgi:hypothetical protein
MTKHHRLRTALVSLGAAAAVAAVALGLVTVLGPAGASDAPSTTVPSIAMPHAEASHPGLRLLHRLRVRAHHAVKRCERAGGSRDDCRARVRAKVQAFISCMHDHGIDREWFRAHRPLSTDDRAALHDAVTACRPASGGQRRSTIRGA